MEKLTNGTELTKVTETISFIDYCKQEINQILPTYEESKNGHDLGLWIEQNLPAIPSEEISDYTKAWSKELNAYYEHAVSDFGGATNDPFSEPGLFLNEAIGFGIRTFVSLSDTMLENWNTPMDANKRVKTILSEINEIKEIEFGEIL